MFNTMHARLDPICPLSSLFRTENIVLNPLLLEPKIASVAVSFARLANLVKWGLGRILPRSIVKNISGDRAKVRLADLLDAFKACMANELVWIEDFSEDEIEISQDLHEVLEVFAQIRQQDVGEN